MMTMRCNAHSWHDCHPERTREGSGRQTQEPDSSRSTAQNDNPRNRYLFLACFLLLVAPLSAQDLTRRAMPQKWVEPLLPEDLPQLKLRDYVSRNAFEKARAEAFSGRYKIALMSLRKVKSGDAVAMALVKASALRRLAVATRQSQRSAKRESQMTPVRRSCGHKFYRSLGAMPQAITLLREHLQKHKDSIAGHYWLGQAIGAIGRSGNGPRGIRILRAIHRQMASRSRISSPAPRR